MTDHNLFTKDNMPEWSEDDIMTLNSAADRLVNEYGAHPSKGLCDTLVNQFVPGVKVWELVEWVRQ